ncbi:hypothetical protein [Terriglobus roseus]|uniref:Uncharacterized protein n=1 Tax=Terriglobus roseus TaxID=392734 RepID=A0A1G7G9Y9_9BACT|nr:hypothetical protein [Terriglobus roseus]SDE84931.1 hypothetical protein SAMN05444167_0623 [Terriglobus roseus]
MSNQHWQDDLQNDEQELTAYHLGEPCDEKTIRARLQTDDAFAALSESIQRTLRVFSAEPVPAPDTHAAWQHLRNSLPVLERTQKTRFWQQFVLVPAGIIAAVLVVAAFFVPRLLRKPAMPDEAGVIQLRPPATNVATQDVSNHLDSAERWLTVVNHATAPLDEQTQAEGERLLTSNAVYLRDARSRGDLPDAFALERLGRVLTSAHNAGESGVQLRVEMNTDGLLFDLRILRQNHSHLTGEPQ